MIILIHKNDELLNAYFLSDKKKEKIDSFENNYMNSCFFEVAQLFPNENIIWCDKRLEDKVNFTYIDACLNDSLHMLSCHQSEDPIFNKVIDYANFNSTVMHMGNKQQKFQTWLMSESLGIINANLINKFMSLKNEFSFQITLNAISKLGSPLGLLHYHEPTLYTGEKIKTKQESYKDTLLFIKTFQKKKWLVYIALLSLLKHQSKLLAIFISYFKSVKEYEIQTLVDLYDNLETKPLLDDELDVLIPTLGRKKHLKDVLDDLSKQSHLPKNVIVIEQHPDKESKSELDYIYQEKWPFTIKHEFIHQLGACNARNIGLKLVESKWLFMADDDIRIPKETLEKNLKLMHSLDVYALCIGTYLPHQKTDTLSKTPYLFEGFASGASIVHEQYFKKISYNMAYEFGYGEDTAYGNELKKLGALVLYSPIGAMLHLKADVGGFRFTFKHPWYDDNIQPKPSPTIMYLNESYMSDYQLFGYKVSLFIEQAIANKKINLIQYKNIFEKKWEKSQYWASQYKKDSK